MKHRLVDQWQYIKYHVKNEFIRSTNEFNIIRDYLQVKILDKIYQEKKANEILFVGGTSLRFLHGLDRFSEDLDFDLGEIEKEEVDEILKKVVSSLNDEKIQVEFYINRKTNSFCYELRFPQILFLLGLSSYGNQQLVIKLNFEKFWRGQKRDVLPLNKYGFFIETPTIIKNHILVEKIHSFLNRSLVLPSDIYDIVWLLSKRVVIDWRHIDENSEKFSNDFCFEFRSKIIKEYQEIQVHKKTIKSLLFFEEKTGLLDSIPNFFPKKEDIRYLGMSEKDDVDANEYFFHFEVKKNHRVRFVVRITHSEIIKEKLNEEEVENMFLNEIIKFYQKNPVINYKTTSLWSIRGMYDRLEDWIDLS